MSDETIILIEDDIYELIKIKQIFIRSCQRKSKRFLMMWRNLFFLPRLNKSLKKARRNKECSNIFPTEKHYVCNANQITGSICTEKKRHFHVSKTDFYFQTRDIDKMMYRSMRFNDYSSSFQKLFIKRIVGMSSWTFLTITIDGNLDNRYILIEIMINISTSDIWPIFTKLII